MVVVPNDRIVGDASAVAILASGGDLLVVWCCACLCCWPSGPGLYAGSARFADCRRASATTGRSVSGGCGRCRWVRDGKWRKPDDGGDHTRWIQQGGARFGRSKLADGGDAGGRCG